MIRSPSSFSRLTARILGLRDAEDTTVPSPFLENATPPHPLGGKLRQEFVPCPLGESGYFFHVVLEFALLGVPEDVWLL